MAFARTRQPLTSVRAATPARPGEVDPMRGERFPTYFKSYPLAFRVVKDGVAYEFGGAPEDKPVAVLDAQHVAFFLRSSDVYQCGSDGEPVQTAAHRRRRGKVPLQVAVRRGGNLVDLDPAHPVPPPPDGAPAAPARRPENAVQVVLAKDPPPVASSVTHASEAEVHVQTAPRTVTAGTPRQRALTSEAVRQGDASAIKRTGFGVRVSRRRGAAVAAASVAQTVPAAGPVVGAPASVAVAVPPAPAPATAAPLPPSGVTVTRVGGPAPAAAPAPVPVPDLESRQESEEDALLDSTSAPPSPEASTDPQSPGGAEPSSGETPAPSLSPAEVASLPTATREELVALARRLGVPTGRKRAEQLREELAAFPAASATP